MKDGKMLDERFWSKVEKTDECWLWTGCINKIGFGKFKFEGSGKSVHRLVYEDVHGKIPKEHVVGHSCDNLSCVNPDHLYLKNRPKDIVERFRSYVEKNPNGCWLWTGYTNKAGYGYFGVQKKIKYAHRVSYEEANGPIPEGLCVCHHCDVPGCVNPDHLFLGTDADNNADMIKKGRAVHPKGEELDSAKLTEAEVLEIRRRVNTGNYESQRKLGKEFGVHYSLISKIVKRKAWAHV